MSKKTRKKSSRSPSRKVASASTRASNKRAASTSGQKMAAAKSGKNAKIGQAKASPKPSKRPAADKQTSAVRFALAEGAQAPSFELPRDGGGTVSLADYAGRKLVVFFYPRADTPGCTKEAIDFTRLSGAFADTGTAVLGVSADPLKAQEAFRNKHQLSVPLLSDEKHQMLSAYGAWGEKSMYGRTFQGILRTTVLIGFDGRVIRVWRNVRVDGHADAVLATTQAL